MKKLFTPTCRKRTCATIGRYLFSAYCLLLLPTFCFSQQNKIDSLLNVLKTAKHDTTKASIYVALSEKLAASNIDTVIPLCLKAIQIIDARIGNANAKEKKSLLIMKANAQNNIGYVYWNKGDITKALDWYHKGLKVLKEIGDKKSIATLLSNIASIYNNNGDILKSLECFHKVLKLQQDIGDRRGIAHSFNNIGFIYNNQGDIPKALDWYHKSLKIREEIGDKNGIADSHNNIGYIYYNQVDLPKALEFYSKSLKIQEEIGDKKGVANSLNNIGSIYKNQGDIPKALECYHKSLKIQEEIGDKQGIATSLTNIGIIYLKQKNYKQAEDYCSRSLQKAKELGFPANIRNASQTLSKIYKEMGVSTLTPLQRRGEYFRQALEMHELFKQMADSINNVETRKSSLKKQMQYDFEKKEAQTKAEQEKKDVIAQEELQRQKVVRNSFIGGFTLVLILALVVFRSYRQKHKANIAITEQKRIIEEKQKEILDSIHYAKRIQTALITNEKYIDKNLNRLMKD